MDRLLTYHWPGNVRELENVIERAVVLCGEREIGIDLIPDHVSANPRYEVADVVIPAEGIHFREVIVGHERRYIEAALDAAGGVQKKAAELAAHQADDAQRDDEAIRDPARNAGRDPANSTPATISRPIPFRTTTRCRTAEAAQGRGRVSAAAARIPVAVVTLPAIAIPGGAIALFALIPIPIAAVIA